MRIYKYNVNLFQIQGRTTIIHFCVNEPIYFRIVSGVLQEGYSVDCTKVTNDRFLGYI